MSQPIFSDEELLEEILNDMVENSVKQLAAKCVCSSVAEQIKNKIIRRTIRKMLFEIIQDSVDTIYFLEEDTIEIANKVLDSCIKQEIKGLVLEESNLNEQVQCVFDDSLKK